MWTVESYKICIFILHICEEGKKTGRGRTPSAIIIKWGYKFKAVYTVRSYESGRLCIIADCDTRKWLIFLKYFNPKNRNFWMFYCCCNIFYGFVIRSINAQNTDRKIEIYYTKQCAWYYRIKWNTQWHSTLRLHFYGFASAGRSVVFLCLSI